MPVAESVWIGFDPREVDGFAVTKQSILRRTILPIPVKGVVLHHLREEGLYTRPTSRVGGRLIDHLSARADYDGAMSTEFAISRFLVPYLAETGWALFVDCGTKDQYNLVYGARRLHATLEREGVPHIYEEFPDNHSSTDYRMDRSLPILATALTNA